MSIFRSSENGEKSHRFVCRFFCRPKTGRKVLGLYVVFFLPSENWEKSHRFVCRFLCGSSENWVRVRVRVRVRFVCRFFRSSENW